MITQSKPIKTIKNGPELKRVSVAVIILTINQRDKTLSNLSYLLAQSSSAPNFRIVLWDNGSRDATAEAVGEKYPEVFVHWHPKNLGVASGRNAAASLAIEAFQPAHLLFLDNDIQVEPNFVRALWAPFAENERLGQTQAKLRFMHDKARLNDGGGCQINFVLGRTRPVGFGEVDRGQYDMLKSCVACGGAMMVRTDVFQELGGFDERFSPFGPEDLDFSLRLSKAGYVALYIPQAVGYHEVSHSFSDGYTENYARYKSRHWFSFMERHASPFQKAGFFLLGAPYLAVRMAIREGRQGNLAAVRGMFKGILDILRS